MATTIALITGANKGIGFETARQLGARGVTVLAGARDEARGRQAERALREALGEDAEVRFVPLDVTDAKSAQEAADWIDREYGLDILVNNAAIAVGGGAPSLAYPSSKSALNMVTAMYAKELRDTPVKVNAANPGYTATDLNRHNGFRSVAEGAEASVYLATLGPDGPSGILWGHLWTAGGPADAYGPLPW
jgi:NAD(P)-dependent dehydrogenase (short-subunit alcohol dehydrogenase family)